MRRGATWKLRFVGHQGVNTGPDGEPKTVTCYRCPVCGREEWPTAKPTIVEPAA